MVTFHLEGEGGVAKLGQYKNFSPLTNKADQVFFSQKAMYDIDLTRHVFSLAKTMLQDFSKPSNFSPFQK